MECRNAIFQYEENRNTYLGSASNSFGQGNRNSFIDNPYLATVIWGGPTAQNRWPTLEITSFTSIENAMVYPNPYNGNVTLETNLIIDDNKLISVNGQLIIE